MTLQVHPLPATPGGLDRLTYARAVLSGESEEIVRLLPSFRQMALAVVALTGSPSNTLAKGADVTIALGPLEEVCPLGLAPSTSTTAMIAVGDALAFVLTKMREFTHE